MDLSIRSLIVVSPIFCKSGPLARTRGYSAAKFCPRFPDFLHLNGFNFGSSPSGGFSFQSDAENRSQNNATPSGTTAGSDVLDSNSHELQLEKSNILLLGPTGSG